MPLLCGNCAEPLTGDKDDAIEHIRKCFNNGYFIRRPGAVGVSDSHGHIWYCFSCETKTKNHRSFNSDAAMWQHLNDCHDVFEERDSDADEFV